MDVCEARSVLAAGKRHEAQCQASCQRIALPVLGHRTSAAAHSLLSTPRTRPPPYLLQHDLCCQPAASWLMYSCCSDAWQHNSKHAQGTQRTESFRRQDLRAPAKAFNPCFWICTSLPSCWKMNVQGQDILASSCLQRAAQPGIQQKLQRIRTFVQLMAGAYTWTGNLWRFAHNSQR